MSTAAPVETPPQKLKRGDVLEYISSSRLSCWQQCRRKHYFRYIARIPSKPSPALHLGKVVHSTLQRWNLWRWDKQPYIRNDLRSAFQDAWKSEQLDQPIEWESEQKEAELRDKAWSLVEAYLDASIISDDEEIAGVEVRLEAEIDGLPPIIGIIDLVRQGGRIVDFKTAAKSPSEASVAHTHSTQLALYALLYRHCTGETEGGVELHHLIKTKTPKVCVTEIEPLSDREIHNVLELMHRYVKSVREEDYTSSPSFLCASCEYLGQCKRWSSTQNRQVA